MAAPWVRPRDSGLRSGNGIAGSGKRHRAARVRLSPATGRAAHRPSTLARAIATCTSGGVEASPAQTVGLLGKVIGGSGNGCIAHHRPAARGMHATAACNSLTRAAFAVTLTLCGARARAFSRSAANGCCVTRVMFRRERTGWGVANLSAPIDAAPPRRALTSRSAPAPTDRLPRRIFLDDLTGRAWRAALARTRRRRHGTRGRDRSPSAAAVAARVRSCARASSRRSPSPCGASHDSSGSAVW